ncbi:aminotransferase class I/II-fold pyridoxal phosphate-dependent enzyme [Planococcus sp. CP5-4]|uniref:threonine aldolase family protein n=1 Tax=unclassified Planococcus (in: firmicutes) TaxID=2662419 RepID=UPI001C241DFB|nr:MULTISPECIES: aminotransferase class I/II-fold pyridoxal phosphate-dependent enzyme [unclassified Planococcus (in: firmicutes)]MBU9674085.1 aminotransferase class I/II-fold pyridoxal phosphate-dependent enzyme [Planococcus sp. CP5-4_YE]MBV0909956.1 aminotransferase class I/II-fold pyridoxal phosphate-dependent enzyme [Planococcus sp. CP5-4_UN]MBW6064836.1 aminotransferase class I/II-fold pyridoxal phosphate-dependent enzyme [Planococcus sp. CP5-4]
MAELNQLQSVFKQSEYQLANHGSRNVGVLKKAFEEIADDVESDLYGTGQVIEDFQEKMAAFLGKETAVFFPSGTMAQQIALRIWCDDKGLKRVAYHPLSHLEIHEEDGLKELHGIESVYLTDPDRVVELKDVAELEEEVAVVLLELPQREIGGQLPSFETLEQISRYCREHQIKLHLDGARLLEVTPYYEKSAAEICALFDSVYLSLYKGIGGIAGAILAGDEAFTKQSKVWERRHGGDLISLYPYIISADYYFDQRSGKMGQYFEAAKRVAALFNSCQGVATLPEVPVSNMFHVHFAHSKEEIEPVIMELEQETGIGITSYLKEVDSGSCYFEVSMGDEYAEIPADLVQEAFKRLDQKMKEQFSE